jgi:hypothetical protein
MEGLYMRQVMILESQRAAMLANWQAGQDADDERDGDAREHDPRPVVKLFNPCGAATWLLTELIEYEDDTVGFGLCDLGLGFPELGYVSLSELAAVELPGGLYIERDEHFTADKTLAEYARIARETGRVTA